MIKNTLVSTDHAWSVETRHFFMKDKLNSLLLPSELFNGGTDLHDLSKFLLLNPSRFEVNSCINSGPGNHGLHHAGNSNWSPV